MSKFAANAILTKSRAKYGRRLTPQNFRDMVSQETVTDVASYLKSRTHYADVLQGAKESLLHRGNLEVLLKNKLSEDFWQLCRFEKSLGERLFEYIFLRDEINQILTFLQYFISGSPRNFMLSLNDIYKNRSRAIDFTQLGNAESYDDILSFFEGTEYHRLLTPFRPDETGHIDFTMIEAVLHRHLYNRLFEITEKRYSGVEKKELEYLFGLQAELENISRLYRGKKYYKASSSLLRAEMMPYRRYLNKSQMNELVEAGSAEDLIETLKKTAYGKFFKEIEHYTIDDLLRRIFYRNVQREMRTSANPGVVMICCIILFDFEIDDVTNIIEGVRYKLSPEAISRLLIL